MIETLTASYLVLQVVLGVPDLSKVQDTPEEQELASLADKIRDYSQWYRWDELSDDTKRVLEEVWGERR